MTPPSRETSSSSSRCSLLTSSGGALNAGAGCGAGRPRDTALTRPGRSSSTAPAPSRLARRRRRASCGNREGRASCGSSGDQQAAKPTVRCSRCCASTAGRSVRWPTTGSSDLRPRPRNALPHQRRPDDRLDPPNGTRSGATNSQRRLRDRSEHRSVGSPMRWLPRRYGLVCSPSPAQEPSISGGSRAASARPRVSRTWAYGTATQLVSPDPPTELRFAAAGALPDGSAVVGPRVIHRLELAGSAVDTPASERRPGRVASLLVRQGLCGLLAVVGGDQGDALVWIGPVADLKFGGVPAGQGDVAVTEALHPLLGLACHLQVYA